MLQRYFRLRERGTSAGREALAGLTTFLAMSYILVVQPQVLSTDFNQQPTGLEPGAVLLATCLSAAFATLVMGLWARLPIGLAPGMGQNYFFVSVIMALAAAGFERPWQTALGIVLVAGVIFVGLTALGVRAALLHAMSPSLRSAVAVGIGTFIAFIGLQNGSLIVGHPKTLVMLNAGGLLSAEAAVFWTGLFTTLLLTLRRVPGAIVLGIAASAVVAAALGKLEFQGIVGLPQFDQPAALQMDVWGALSLRCLPFVIVFVFMDVFDTLGTLVGVGHQAGLIDEDGNIPRLGPAMAGDALGTVAGAALGTSTVTCYIESAAGVQQGGRTGLVAVTVALLFLAALVFSPLIIALCAYPPITAPALVVVGAMMFSAVRHIEWTDETEAVPAFLLIVGMPLFYSIADGLALGFIVWPLLKLAAGRGREVSWLMYAMAAVLVAYFLLVRVNIT